MLVSSTPRKRLVGRVMIASAILIALPLSASRAIEYVDVAKPVAPAKRPTMTPADVAVPTADATQVPPAAVAVPSTPAAEPRAAPATSRDLSIHDGFITIDGKTKRWEDLTPAEKAEVRGAVAKARTALENTHLDQAQLTRDLAAVQQIRLGDLQRDLAQAQAGVAEAMRSLDASGPYLRSSGRDPEQLKATIRSAMDSVHGIDAQAIQRSIAAIDQRKIAASIAGAQDSMRAAKAELDRLDVHMKQDRHD